MNKLLMPFKRLFCNHEFHDVGELNLRTRSGFITEHRVLYCPKCKKEKYLLPRLAAVEEAKESINKLYAERK